MPPTTGSVRFAVSHLFTEQLAEETGDRHREHQRTGEDAGGGNLVVLALRNRDEHRCVHEQSAAIAEIQIDRTIAFGALVAAPWVSSLTCAEASKPVIVYLASRSPTRPT